MPLSETIISKTPQQRKLLPRTESINELTIASRSDELLKFIEHGKAAQLSS
jgi:hypothetical protein